MAFYEVLIADSKYRGNEPLTYSSDETISNLTLVSVPLRGRIVNGFISKKVAAPRFKTLPIKSVHSVRLPKYSLALAGWLAQYYGCSLGEAMRQFTPSGAAARRTTDIKAIDLELPKLALEETLTRDQAQAIKQINSSSARTIILHGETGSGKTRVYLELATATLKNGRSVILLTPEIALTAQLEAAAKAKLNAPVFVIHSQLTPSARKKLWMQIACAAEPVVIIGPRSALFSPVASPGLIALDEAHEPAYKQDQTPRYHASRVASKLAELSDAKVILGSATPLVTDYYLAEQHQAVVRMSQPASSVTPAETELEIVDLRDKTNFSTTPYISRQMLEAITDTLAAGKQAMIYLNRRGTARQILCTNCGWQLLCPNCDLPLVYHHDHHEAVCHTCGHTEMPPSSCPVCGQTDLIYKTAGTKLLAENLQRLFPSAKLHRFDSDNSEDETVQKLYGALRRGQIDIIVGTQLLAKGLDLPKLGLVGVIAADSSLSLPDFSTSERTFQLLYQVLGRVGRGHGRGLAVVQTFAPDDPIIKAALTRDWSSFYKTTLSERRTFGFPPSVYMLKMVCKRASQSAAKKAAVELKRKIADSRLPVNVIGPTPSFYARRGDFHYWQLTVKSKQRAHLLEIAGLAGSSWGIDLDPLDLL